MEADTSLTYPDYESIVELYTDSIYSMYDMTPGQIRGAKGMLVESMADAILHLAWYVTFSYSNGSSGNYNAS